MALSNCSKEAAPPIYCLCEGVASNDARASASVPSNLFFTIGYYQKAVA